MKKFWFSFIAMFILFLVGCAHFPQETRFIQIDNSFSKGELLEIAIDLAREMNFPPMTKLDKSNGIVEFGEFGAHVTGITAQVRIAAKNKIDITVVRGSVYVPLPVKDIADEFKRKFESKLKAPKK